jgi:putative intracellular protease/amidase
MSNTQLDRRQVLALAGAAGLSAGLGAAETGPLPVERAGAPPGALKIAMLVHPKMVALDLIGPLTVFNILRCDVHLVWKDRTPVSTDVGIPFAPTQTFAECPADLDVLFVPGGITGTVDCMNDRVVTDFLADRGARAKWVTSVCTGSLVLGAAGLLRGYDATSHWTVVDVLPTLGARYRDARIVTDRNRVTGGGVTAGIDFGLSLAAHLLGEEAARRSQLVIEYAPAPPFRSGTPAEADPGLVAKVRVNRPEVNRQVREAAAAAATRLGI